MYVYIYSLCGIFEQQTFHKGFALSVASGKRKSINFCCCCCCFAAKCNFWLCDGYGYGDSNCDGDTLFSLTRRIHHLAHTFYFRWLNGKDKAQQRQAAERVLVCECVWMLLLPLPPAESEWVREREAVRNVKNRIRKTGMRTVVRMAMREGSKDKQGGAAAMKCKRSAKSNERKMCAK